MSYCWKTQRRRTERHAPAGGRGRGALLPPGASTRPRTSGPLATRAPSPVSTMSLRRGCGGCASYGQQNRYEHVEEGFNSRLDPVQAAVLLVKLGVLERDNQRRREIGERYDQAFASLQCVRPLPVPRDCQPNRHLYPVVVEVATRRPEFQAALARRGIESLIHYPIAMPDQRASDPAWSGDRSFPVARSLCARLVSLPLHPDLTDDEARRVIEGVLTWAQET